MAIEERSVHGEERYDSVLPAIDKEDDSNDIVQTIRSLRPDHRALLSLASACRRSSLKPQDHRSLALDLSLYINIGILVTKVAAYAMSGSLSVLASLVDSALDILSQAVLYWAEKKSRTSSVALYPAGASRFEPVGVIICAAVMGMGSFQVISESVQTLFQHALADTTPGISSSDSSVFSMISIIGIKVMLFMYCKAVSELLSASKSGESSASIEAMYQDHLNDALSNAVAVAALVLSNVDKSLWWLDATGAIIISVYILYSWYETGSEEIEKIVGRAADQEMIDRLSHISSNSHPCATLDVCRCYHFGPKFLVEVEIVLPSDMVLRETHDIGMELQYRLEREAEVERAFVHIDYRTRSYDEHQNSRRYSSYQHQKSIDQQEDLERMTQSPTSEQSSEFEIL